MKNKIFFTLLLLILLQSCNGTQYDTDYIIEKYNEEDFSCLKGAFVNIRGGKHDDLLCLLISSTANIKCNPYIVKINYDSGEIVTINDTLPKRDCNGYFTNNQIKNFTKCFLKYKFQVLAVDLDGNVYINPGQQGHPTLLRKVPNSTPEDIKDFKLYKDKWYIRNE
ncbi:hypothetical protein M0M57_13835 [Flavobacterium azooxidireducens]|uniref:Lipoprotein n=1 Tax=Flavobacterium azooxidireducens TaxID=1871076 RepID=A0ABY4KD93_9FLAO|nr:hypothetical protein [Flavobacterium azooxidireducens]UPQ78694.1 hypothetical protein M0M57_13835 [Flavobacterium azooxidireducens]